MKKFLKSLVVLALVVSSLVADKLDDVKQAGVLKAGASYDFKPFGFLDKDKKVIGFDIDLLKYIAQDLGVKLEIQQAISNRRVPMVAKGIVDIAAASMTHKVTRDDTIDFTISYFYDGQSILARKSAKQRSAKDFAGLKVGAIEGSTSSVNFKKLVPEAQIVYFQEYPQAVKALYSKKVDAVTTDLVWCATQANDSGGKLKVVGGTISEEPYGMGVPENESRFRDAINFAIQNSVKDGTYIKLYRKWFGEDPKVMPEVWP